MSSSGKGQSVLKSDADIEPAWQYAMAGGRVNHGRVIVEGFIDFEYEITQLTVRATDPASGASRHILLRTRSATCRWRATTSNRGSRSR